MAKMSFKNAFLLLGAAFISFSSMAYADKEFHKVEQKIHDLKEKLEQLELLDKKIYHDVKAVKCDLRCESKVIHIRQKDLPFTADVPGVYCLVEDATYIPITQDTAAITVLIGPVVIDLNGHTLSQNGYMPGTSGVLVNGASNVIIKNGKTQNFTQNGIQVTGGSSEVFIDSILATGNGVITSPSAFVFNSTCGLFLKDSTQIQVQNSNFDENIGGNGAGISITGCNEVVLDNVTCNRNTGALLPIFTGTNGFGLGLIGVAGNPYVKTISNVWVKNSQFNENSGTRIGQGCLVNTLSGAIKNVIFENCVFNNNFRPFNSVSGGNAAGLLIERTSNIIISGCSASGNDATLASGSVGFGINCLFSINNAIIENCQANDNLGTSLSTSFAVGASTAKSVLLKNCQATYSASNISPSVTAIGFRINGTGVGNVMESCVAQGYQGASGSTGILVSGQTNMVIQNCTSSDNSVGLLFDNSASSKNLIQNTTCIGNVVAGFQDLTTSASNAYISNIARSNGSGGTANYVGAIFPPVTCPNSCSPVSGMTPIRKWTLPGALCPVNTNCVSGDKLDNIDISP